MANRTATEAQNIHGTNPQFLIEKIIRTRIYDSLYWKESCFALTAETLIDKAVNLTSIGGQYGNQKPTEFLCLALKMLQLQPEKEIVRLYIQNEDYKYLRALGAFYLRLTGTAVEIYQYLEPLLLDYRKLRRRNISGEFELTHVDEFVDDLLRSERVCDTILPRITKRHILEENGDLEPRLSPLEEDLEDEEIAEDSEGEITSEGEKMDQSRRTEGDRKLRTSSRERHDHRDSYRDSKDRDRRRDRRSHSSSRSHSRSRSRRRDRYSSKRSSRDRDRDRSRSRSRTRSRSRSTHRRNRETSRDRYRPSRRDRSRSRERSRDRRDRYSDYHRGSREGERYRRDDRSRGSPEERRSREREDNEESRAVPEGIKKKPSVSSKKVNALFKKTAVQAGEPKKAGKEGGGGASESLSVEETNKMRAALGLKPLKM